MAGAAPGQVLSTTRRIEISPTRQIECFTLFRVDDEDSGGLLGIVHMLVEQPLLLRWLKTNAPQVLHPKRVVLPSCDEIAEVINVYGPSALTLKERTPYYQVGILSFMIRIPTVRGARG